MSSFLLLWPFVGLLLGLALWFAYGRSTHFMVKDAVILALAGPFVLMFITLLVFTSIMSFLESSWDRIFSSDGIIFHAKRENN